MLLYYILVIKLIVYIIGTNNNHWLKAKTIPMAYNPGLKYRDGQNILNIDASKFKNIRCFETLKLL